MTTLTYSSETRIAPIARGRSVGGILRQFVTTLLDRADKRRQRIAFERLDEHLRRDIGLPPRFTPRRPQVACRSHTTH